MVLTKYLNGVGTWIRYLVYKGTCGRNSYAKKNFFLIFSFSMCCNIGVVNNLFRYLYLFVAVRIRV